MKDSKVEICRGGSINSVDPGWINDQQCRPGWISDQHCWSWGGGDQWSLLRWLLLRWSLLRQSIVNFNFCVKRQSPHVLILGGDWWLLLRQSLLRQLLLRWSLLRQLLLRWSLLRWLLLRQLLLRGSTVNFNFHVKRQLPHVLIWGGWWLLLRGSTQNCIMGIVRCIMGNAFCSTTDLQVPSVCTSFVKFVIYWEKNKKDRLVYSFLVKLEHYCECLMWLRPTWRRNK